MHCKSLRVEQVGPYAVLVSVDGAQVTFAADLLVLRRFSGFKQVLHA